VLNMSGVCGRFQGKEFNLKQRFLKNPGNFGINLNETEFQCKADDFARSLKLEHKFFCKAVIYARSAQQFTVGY